jgi:hypothetical protein
VVCCAGALLAVAGGLVLGHWQAGLVLGLGLVIGSLNGFLIRGTLSSELGFRATSGLRLLALSVAAFAVAALVDVWLVPVAVAGVALAQVALAVVSAVQMVRQ